MYSDESATTPEVHRKKLGFGDGEWIPDASRESCKPEDLVFGDMVSMVRYPLKLTWVEGQEMLLHDLSWDPGELSDQLKLQPDLAKRLVPELEAFVEERIINRSRDETGEVSEETTRALKSLGYID